MDVPMLSEGDLPVDANLVHDVARGHPEVTTLAQAGLSRIEHAEMLGLVPLGLPLPRGRRDLLVPSDRRDAVRREIAGLIDRAMRRAALLERGRRVLDGADLLLAPAAARDQIVASRIETLPWPGFRHPLRIAARRVVPIDALEGLDDADLRARLADDPQLTAGLERGLGVVAAFLHDIAERIGEADDSWTFDHLAERFGRIARTRHDADDLVVRWRAAFDTWIGERAQARGRAFVDTHFDLARFEQLFPVARGLGRRIVLVVGPTNSGKTHRAVEALKAAASGVYLAPLRLLALEVMDRLNAEGTPATLLTGEEEIAVPGARIISSTIEMLDTERPVDVAVIDEIQMLGDPDRGWAWTAALMGVPGRTVYVLGAPEARGIVERAAAHLGEPLEVIELERMGPLVMLDRRVEWADVTAGDALIAFSRREVHAVRETVLARGLSAAMVYGALAPEVRRREAARFLAGEADVVVATDAIGMGLNLPVRRVLFTTLEKFDGVAVRPLTAAEIRQIAGRAGRFGKADSGAFGVIGRGTPEQLQTLLTRPDPRLGRKMLMTVRPTRGMLDRLSRHIGVDDLALLLDCFATARTQGSPYRVADLAPLRGLATDLDTRDLAFGDKLQLLFMPADIERETDATVFRALCRAIERKETVPLGLVVPLRIEALDDQRLEDASRACDLYYWSARKFPRACPEIETVRARRDEIGRRLAEVLATRARRRKDGRQDGGSRPDRPKPGFRGAPRKRFGPRRP
jgi:ATP-dependent RNA helicase SUPV3L1/SUV3